MGVHMGKNANMERLPVASWVDLAEPGGGV